MVSVGLVLAFFGYSLLYYGLTQVKATLTPRPTFMQVVNPWTKHPWSPTKKGT